MPTWLIENRLFRTALTVLLFLDILRSYIWFGLVTKRILRDGKLRRRRIHRLHEKNARRVYRAFIMLKGVYIKVGQFLSTQLILPPEYLAEMVKMQDRIPEASTESIQARILKEYGKPASEVFASFEGEPLACASIGQVHRVKLKDGRDAVLKVKYPGIDHSFLQDLKLLKSLVPLFIRVIEVVYYGARSGIDHKATVGEFVKYIRLELDYANEIENHKRMYAILKDYPGSSVPRLIEELCTHSTICMEYIDGRKMFDLFTDPKISDEGKNEVYCKLAGALLYQISKYGFFQADTHPGNFLVIGEEGAFEVVFLDFGCAKQLPDVFRTEILKAIQGYINRDPRMSAQAYWDMGFRTKKKSIDSLVKWAEYVFGLVDVVLDHFQRGEALIGYLKENATTLMEESYALSHSDRIDYIPEEYIMFGRAIATPPVPFDRFQPKVDILALIMPHMANLGMPQATIPDVG